MNEASAKINSTLSPLTCMFHRVLLHLMPYIGQSATHLHYFIEVPD